ncbi:hypothetical protein L2089_05060 [Paenibacillus hunanensis]|uniref:hypothetical protein n=1 Tax=Paenibacillus hunanensis TaxID=539262 RepID=UPI002026CD35|nr:hypothetical protein [Paenibacillus hunanensis]MCL9660044.1 hypothetical protein [Paenibacillus hunanensis]
MKEFLSKWKRAVTYKDSIPGEKSTWGHEGLLFNVKGGLGRLAVKYGSNRKGDSYRFVMLGDQPIMYSYGDYGYGPVCDHMLGVGLGQPQADIELINGLKQAQQTDQSMLESFEQMIPLLATLEDGYYILTRIEMIPTDGEGSFFWNIPQASRLYQATADEIFYKEQLGCSTPKFLVPSQPTQQLNRDRVDHYVSELKQGKRMTGLAYYYSGFISTLLDGHHRATAAYIENQTIDCLTIMHVNGYTSAANGKPVRFYAAGETYDADLFQQSEQMLHDLKQRPLFQSSKLSKNKVEAILQMYANRELLSDLIEPFKGLPKRIYPDYLLIAFDDYTSDMSIEHIDRLIEQADEDAQFALEMILRRLALNESDDILPIAKRILNHPGFKCLLEEVFYCLTRIDDEQVEDIFIQYLIDHEPDNRDRCRQIANEYLNQR